MGSFSLWHWLIFLLMGFLVVFPTWRILHRVGLPGPLGLLALVPFLNLLMLWVFALVRWPIDRDRSAS